MIRVALVDDHRVVSRGVHSFLESFGDLSVVGLAANAEELLARLDEWLPDVVVMDLLMPGGMDGVEATRWIARYVPGVQVVGMSATDASIADVAMRAAGAIGFVSKDEGMRHIVEALHATAVERESLSTGIEN